MVISTFVTGKSPYKNVLVNDLLLDKNGQKMHKSRGNAIEPFTLIKKNGSDTIRWYLPYVSPVWTPIKFDEEGLKEVYSKFFSTLKNTYSFFALYANTDNVDPRKFDVKYEDLEEIDKWLISKYNKLLLYVTKAYDEYDLTRVVRSVTDFVSEDLSNWYIRRTRRRFWAHDLDNSKKAVYKTTYEVLVGLCKIIAPIASYISEEIYTKLTNEESVHLSDFPKANLSLVNDRIENKMDLVRNLISLGRNAREEVKIKVRQPIKEILIDGKNKDLIGNLEDLIKEELNVKEVTYISDLSKYMDFEVKPNFKIVGKILGPKIKTYQEELLKLTNEDIKFIENGEAVTITIDEELFDVTKEMVDIRVTAKEGYNVIKDANNFIILNTNLTKDLVNEGIARELISKVQNLRKQKDFDVSDRIYLYYEADDSFDEVIKDFENIIKKETLSLELIKKDGLTLEFDLNGLNVKQ